MNLKFHNSTMYGCFCVDFIIILLCERFFDPMNLTIFSAIRSLPQEQKSFIAILSVYFGGLLFQTNSLKYNPSRNSLLLIINKGKMFLKKLKA